MKIYDVVCKECRFLFDRGIGGTKYVTDDKGERVACPHPVEWVTIRQVLGRGARDELIAERSGYLQCWLCRSCLRQCELDEDRDQHRCLHCRSTTGNFLKDMIGKRCPRCWRGEIECIDTGSIT